MPYIELNPASGFGEYEVTAIEHRMGRASLLRFRRKSDLGDSDALSTRTQVRYTVNGVIWFAGVILPASRRIASDSDSVEYVAADFAEFMAHNPVDEVNRFYNRTVSDAAIFAYPENQTIEDILTTEFASLVGSGLPILALDFSDIGDLKDYVIRDFEVRGRTWQGLLEAVLNELPVLSYWLDPTTITGTDPDSDDNVGYTLRFYDISLANPAGQKNAVLVNKNFAASNDGTPNVLSISLQEDISQSYDSVTLIGWGDMTEKNEKLTADWSGIGSFGSFLRRNPTTGAIEKYDPTSGSGVWVAASASPAAWYSESPKAGDNAAYRRYKTSTEIVDLKLVRDGSVSPARIIRAEQSMSLESLAYLWDMGSLVFTKGGTTYGGTNLNGNTKLGVPYVGDGPGFVDDSGNQVKSKGSVIPSPDLYPSYPSPPLTSRRNVGSPAAFERDRVLLPERAVWTTYYKFNANLSGNAGYNNLVNEYVHVHWPAGADIWMRYTGKTELSVTSSIIGAGYNKHLKIWDQRFVKYTDLDGVVLRDDTAIMTEYLDAMATLLSRPRVYGTMEIRADPDSVMTDWPMGCGVKVTNWQGSATPYELPVRAQGVVLTRARDEWVVSIEFDGPNTFVPLEKATRFRQFFALNEQLGTGGNAGAGVQAARGSGLAGGGGSGPLVPSQAKPGGQSEGAPMSGGSSIPPSGNDPYVFTPDVVAWAGLPSGADTLQLLSNVVTSVAISGSTISITRQNVELGLGFTKGAASPYTITAKLSARLNGGSNQSIPLTTCSGSFVRPGEDVLPTDALFTDDDGNVLTDEDGNPFVDTDMYPEYVTLFNPLMTNEVGVLCDENLEWMYGDLADDVLVESTAFVMLSEDGAPFVDENGNIFVGD